MVEAVDGVVGRGAILSFQIEGGVPEVTKDRIEWYKDGSTSPVNTTSRVTIQMDGRSLSVDPVIREDEGNYTIVVDHPSGTMLAHIFLNVQGSYHGCMPI